MIEKLIEHISYSAYKEYKNCPLAFKLKYINKIKTPENIHSIFGTAIHATLEEFLKKDKYEDSEILKTFSNNFESEIKRVLNKEYKEDLLPAVISDEDKQTFLEQGKNIIVQVIQHLREIFGDFEVVETEEDLNEVLDDGEYFNNKELGIFLKGFIDLIIKKDDQYYIIDYKTCSWGWDKYKKGDKLTTYQLVLYKYFWCKKHNIDPKNVETYFLLLKRTPKNNNVEAFRVTSGNIKTKNALDDLDGVMASILVNKMFIKDRRGCKYCMFKKTKYCP